MPISFQPADFGPDVAHYNRVKPFRYWCQMVLPTVYDDSLSYYELLNKVVEYLNLLNENNDTIIENQETLDTAYDDLQDYVNNNVERVIDAFNDLQVYVDEYFYNLDVQDEINNKLDELAANGTLTALVRQALPDEIDELVPPAVSDWLDENITPTTPAVDASLSVSGAAADAKAAGDWLREIDDSYDWKLNSSSSLSRTRTIEYEVNAGDVLVLRINIPTDTAWMPEYLRVYGRNLSNVQIVQLEFVNGKHYFVQFEEHYDNVVLGFVKADSSAPETAFTVNAWLAVKNHHPGLKMLSSGVANKKKLSILGASISTYEGTIPEGYSKYYPYTGSAYDGTTYRCVKDIHDMYWQKVCDALDMQLLVNNSSSGSYLTTGHGNDSMAGCGDRCISLGLENYNDPDYIVIQLGLNDFNAEVGLGSYNGTQAFPTSTTTFREAYAVMLKKILERYRYATVICGTITNHENNFTAVGFPEKNDSGVLLSEYNKAIKEIADLFGVKVVDWYSCGITYQNMSNLMQDYNSDSHYGQHPNKFGHTLMANELIKVIDPSCKDLYQLNINANI